MELTEGVLVVLAHAIGAYQAASRGRDFFAEGLQMSRLS